MDTKIDEIAEQIMNLFNADDSKVPAVVKLLSQAYSVGLERASRHNDSIVTALEFKREQDRMQFLRENAGRIYVQLRREAFEEAHRHGFVPSSEANSSVLFLEAWDIASKLWKTGNPK